MSGLRVAVRLAKKVGAELGRGEVLFRTLSKSEIGNQSAIRYERKETMNNAIGKRIFGFILFCAGVGLSIWLKSAHDTGGSIDERLIILPPILILVGLSATINPALMIGRNEYSTAPMALRVCSALIAIVGACIGLWLRYVVFKDWSDHR